MHSSLRGAQPVNLKERIAKGRGGLENAARASLGMLPEVVQRVAGADRWNANSKARAIARWGVEWGTCKALQDVSTGAWAPKTRSAPRWPPERMPTITAVEFEIATLAWKDGRELIFQPELVHVTNGEQRGVPPHVVGIATEGV
jgi:hypothetical protein